MGDGPLSNVFLISNSQYYIISHKGVVSDESSSSDRKPKK